MKFMTSALLAALAAAVLCQSAQATTTFAITSSSAIAGTTGNVLEITFTTDTSVTFDAFTIELASTSSGLTFTGATTATALTYVFSATSLFGPDISSTPPTLPATTLSASDVSISPVTLAAGTYGLAHITFDLSALVPAGQYTISFTPVGTSLSNGSTPIPIEMTSGTLDVTTVPEPASAALALTGLAATAIIVRRRRRSSIVEHAS